MATRLRSNRRLPHGQAREKILSAAVETFAEKGFEAASTREIALRAGTDQGLLTYHFPSKDQLWRAAADQIFGVLGKQLDDRFASLDCSDPAERSRDVIREFVRFSAAHPEFFRFMVDVGNLSDARARWLVDTHLAPRFRIMRDVGLAPVAGINEAAVPYAFFSLAGAAGLIFAVAPNCRRLTGVDPTKRAAIEAHGNFLADLMVPPSPHHQET
jgi:TetR/AcrR family transcriptional regulator